MPDYGDERGFGGGSATGRSLADVLRDNVPSGMGRSNPEGRRDYTNFFNQWRNPDTTTVPAGFNDPDRFGRMRPTGATNPYAAPIDNNPMRGANIGGGWNLYEGAPDRTPRFMPMQGMLDEMGVGMDSGEYLASRYGGGLDDAAGMNDDARGMIEGAGFEVAAYAGTDKRTERQLWKLAVNKLPVGTPQPQIIEEWEKLKAEFYRRKYGE